MGQVKDVVVGGTLVGAAFALALFSVWNAYERPRRAAAREAALKPVADAVFERGISMLERAERRFDARRRTLSGGLE